MAIYVGLLDEHGKEIAVRGYRRLDLSSYDFMVGPTSDRGYQLAFHLNGLMTFGPFKARCLVRMLALWTSRTGGKPFSRKTFNSGLTHKIQAGDSLVAPRLVFPMRGLPFEKIPPRKQVVSRAD